MKIAVTGHTAGIGKCLFERLSPNVIGFSRSNGYDITIEQDRQRIVEAVRNCHVFVNNANSGFGQTLMFLDVFNSWANDPTKVIINVGSRIADCILPTDRYDLLRYQAEKTILKTMSFRVKGQCRIKYHSLGYVSTEKIKLKYPTLPDGCISEDQAVDLILS